jgi:hypothetical protein
VNCPGRGGWCVENVSMHGKYIRANRQIENFKSHISN